MVSLMGIPPLIGFYAKYYVIVAAMEADMLWLAVAIVVMLWRQRVLLPARGVHDVLR